MYRRPGKAGGRQLDSVPGGDAREWPLPGLPESLGMEIMRHTAPMERLGVQSLRARKPKRKSWNEGVN